MLAEERFNTRKTVAKTDRRLWDWGKGHAVGTPGAVRQVLTRHSDIRTTIYRHGEGGGNGLKLVGYSSYNDAAKRFMPRSRAITSR